MKRTATSPPPQSDPPSGVETARSLLPGLHYLAREASAAGLPAVTEILTRAIHNLTLWIAQHGEPADIRPDPIANRCH